MALGIAAFVQNFCTATHRLRVLSELHPAYRYIYVQVFSYRVVSWKYPTIENCETLQIFAISLDFLLFVVRVIFPSVSAIEFKCLCLLPGMCDLLILHPVRFTLGREHFVSNFSVSSPQISNDNDDMRQNSKPSNTNGQTVVVGAYALLIDREHRKDKYASSVVHFGDSETEIYCCSCVRNTVDILFIVQSSNLRCGYCHLKVGLNEVFS